MKILKQYIKNPLFTLISLLFVYFIFVTFNIFQCREQWGQYGDAFGFFNGFAFIIAMYALYLQKKENAKAERSRKISQYPAVLFKVNDLKSSKEFEKAKDFLLKIFIANSNNYDNTISTWLTNFEKEFTEKGITEEVLIVGSLIDNANKTFNLYKTVYLLCKEGVLEDDYALRFFSINDLFYVKHILQPIIIGREIIENDVFKFYDNLFDSYTFLRDLEAHSGSYTAFVESLIKEFNEDQ